jgi:threonine dehydratase
MLISKSEIEAAERRIKSYLAPTPILYSRYHSALTGADIFLKLETFQPTHSFKVRGAFNAVLALPPEVRRQGIVTASGGNHGLGVALTAAKLGISATIYLPVNTPRIKIDAIRKLGAETVIYGDAWDEANERAMGDSCKRHQAYIHPFDDLHVMAGQGTMVCELITQVPEIDLIVASIGGGGLISGLLSAVQHFSPGTRVVGVETLGADCMYQTDLPTESSSCLQLLQWLRVSGLERPHQLNFTL